MNERIHTLAEKAGLYCDGTPDAWDQKAIEKFAELIVRECDELNKKQSYELMGVIHDVENTSTGFDDLCLNTVKRVAAYLNTDLKEHFGVEE
jgi:hypothetical protein